MESVWGEEFKSYNDLQTLFGVDNDLAVYNTLNTIVVKFREAGLICPFAHNKTNRVFQFHKANEEK